jgi:ribosome assembly protein YihI (activator of Der GTPase)
MRLPFCILNVLGDVLDHGDLVFVEATQTLDAAKQRVETLSDKLPRQYVIYNEDTGDGLSKA